MIQPMNLSQRNNPLQERVITQESLDEVTFDDSWLDSLDLYASPTFFNRQQLQEKVAKQRFQHRQLAFEWRAINRGTWTRLSYLSIGDVALSSFCLLLSCWILLIWQSEAPFWWVPGLALFFAVAAVAALHDAIWMTPEKHKSQLRRQLRQNQTHLKRYSNRLALVEAPTNLQS